MKSYSLSPVAEVTNDDPFILANKAYKSRLLVGTGKYKSLELAAAAIKSSGAEIITVAIRRANLVEGEKLEDFLDRNEYTFLPNSAGCYTAEEAVRTLRLAREAGAGSLIKLEVIGDKKNLFPNTVETLKAAEILVKDGFDVMAYTNDDPIVAKKLEEIGCAAIMPLAAPIGSGLGIQNPLNLKIIAEQSKVPVLVDAGIGTASDAAIAMELGCDAVLLNTAIAEAEDPVLMAKAMKLAVEAGRAAYLAGRMKKRQNADPSTSDKGIIT